MGGDRQHPAAVIVVLIAPVYIAPLFNTYTKLNNPKIKESILSMARANGIPATDVYEVDESRQSNRVSANVSGFGKPCASPSTTTCSSAARPKKSRPPWATRWATTF